MLDERKIRILQAIVDDYILTAMPVGSRTLARKYMTELSSATIRNEMSDLEELGYLAQPHTSAGRVPSYMAYRLYVDRMMQVGPLKQDEARYLRGAYSRRMEQMQEALRTASRVIADATQYASVVLPPGASSLRIKHIELVPITVNSALIIIVTDMGVVRDTTIPVPEGLSAEQLHSVSRMLTDHLSEHTLAEVDAALPAIVAQFNMHHELFMQVLAAITQRLSGEESGDVVVDGVSNILSHPEYADMQRARALLTTLESKERVYQLLRRARGVELTISIGPENDIPEMQDCSLVTMSYRLGDHDVGTLGVIGPVRMNYSRVVAVLNTMRGALSQVLTGQDDEDANG